VELLNCSFPWLNDHVNDLQFLTCTRCNELRWVEKSKAADFIESYSLPQKGIMIENTVNCNLECLACSRKKVSSIRKPSKMSLNELRKISLMIREVGIQQVNYFNLGEPFFSKDFDQELEILREDNPDIFIHISTNGQLLDNDRKRNAAMLADHIMFSIDGATQESIEKYQRGANFDKVYQNLTELVKFRDSKGNQRPVIEWKYLLFNWNDNEELINRAIELAKNARVDIISFWPTLSPSWGISWRYYLGTYLKSIGNPSWKGREIDFRVKS